MYLRTGKAGFQVKEFDKTGLQASEECYIMGCQDRKECVKGQLHRDRSSALEVGQTHTDGPSCLFLK